MTHLHVLQPVFTLGLLLRVRLCSGASTLPAMAGSRRVNHALRAASRSDGKEPQ